MSVPFQTHRLPHRLSILPLPSTEHDVLACPMYPRSPAFDTETQWPELYASAAAVLTSYPRVHLSSGI